MKTILSWALGISIGIVATASPQASNAQTVVDAKGKTVGSLYGQEASGQWQYVVRKVELSYVYFAVVAEGLRSTFGPAFYYPTADCSGVAYMESDLNQLIQPGAFIPKNRDDRYSLEGTLIYGGTTRTRLAVYSVRIKYEANGSEGPCTSWGPEMMTVRPAVEQDITSWRLAAPFRIK